MNENIKTLLGIDHPVLATVSKYFFDMDGGKKIRPVMVLLMRVCSRTGLSMAKVEECVPTA